MMSLKTVSLCLILQFLSTTVFSACGDIPVINVDWNNCMKRSENLKDKDLQNANFSRADLMFANLEGANVSGANFTGAVMLGANLEGTNFNNASLAGAFLTKAKIAGAKFNGTILDGATWVNGQKCQPNSIGVCKQK
jgi:uncharacterized protein YjbI with pentapeptide repeats